MEVYYSEPLVDIYMGSALEVLVSLPEKSINMICTSPPYFGLRSYPGSESVWGGDSLCEHTWEKARSSFRPSHHGISSKVIKITEKTSRLHKLKDPGAYLCSKCGATNCQFGCETDLGLYILHTLEFFNEFKRVLRDDGVVFYNLGTSYVTNRSGGGLAKGNDMLIPYRLATILQEQKWIVRNIIHWVKSNPGPEAVQDRFTTSYEPILFLVKKKHYWSDMFSIRQPYASSTYERLRYPVGVVPGSKVYEQIEKGQGHPPQGENLMSMLDIGGANCYDVWLFPTATDTRDKHSKLHFSIYPLELPRRAILAGCPPYTCVECGKPYTRVTRKSELQVQYKESEKMMAALEPLAPVGKTSIFRTGTQTFVQSEGWKKQCNCPSNDTRPGIVLDPFAGTGSTGVAAKMLGRRSILIDLVPDFVRASKARVEGTNAPFEPVTREWKPEPVKEAEGVQLGFEEEK